MDNPRPNDAFDRELCRALAAEGGAAASPHVEAELAAAWMERRLDAATARTIDAHLASCPDCQTMVATLARMAPDSAAAGEGFVWWRRLRAGWLVPATVAAAAALVIWVALPQQRAASTPAEQLQARDERVPVPPPLAVAPAPPATAPAAPPPASRRDAETDRRFAAAVPELQRKAANLEQAPASAAEPAARPAAPELDKRERFADAAAPPPPPPAPPPAALAETITLTPQQPVVDAQAGGKVTVTGETPARAQERQEAARENIGAAAGLRAAAGLVIVAPGGAARWRRTDSAVEFAPRADASFTPVALPVAAATIAAGASPGGTICWLIGRSGLVLVTVDGLRFARATPPAALDLVAVTATDARTAIVTAANGRRFRTTDQGATWSPQ